MSDIESLSGGLKALLFYIQQKLQDCDIAACNVYITPFDGAFDCCDCPEEGGNGTLTGRIINIVPIDDSGCVVALQCTIEITLMRCATQLWPNGPSSAADPEDEAEAAQGVNRDAHLISTAIKTAFSPGSLYTARFTSWTPFEPAGGCVGGIFTAQLNVLI